MPDDLTKRDNRDRERINIREAGEVAYWTKTLGITKADLEAAVGSAGVMVKDVRKYLGQE